MLYLNDYFVICVALSLFRVSNIAYFKSLSVAQVLLVPGRLYSPLAAHFSNRSPILLTNVGRPYFLYVMARPPDQSLLEAGAHKPAI